MKEALRHRSAGFPHYERLEFLGDSLLNLIIAETLFQRWPKADEGALTRARASLVRESTLATIAKELKLGERIEFGPGEIKSGGHRRESILADVLESMVAAIYLEQGFDACRQSVLAWFEPILADLQINKIDKDAKTQLQEWLQARNLARPTYELLRFEGEEHERTFFVACSVQEPGAQFEGEGQSIRAAEQAAAAKVFDHLVSAAKAKK
jgi:ribonuclease III